MQCFNDSCNPIATIEPVAKPLEAIAKPQKKRSDTNGTKCPCRLQN
jgi:hypothetical protein